jgi:hypothetical protein
VHARGSEGGVKISSLARRALVLAMLASTGGRAQEPDSSLARVERLVMSGDRPAARVLADSLLATLAPDSPQTADVLYWRAAAASNAADAERDYLRVSIEHSLSPRAPDALLALAQLEFARGDRTAARRRFDRLLRDYPSGRHVARASLWSGRLAIEERDASGCATLQAARPMVPAADIELRNQFNYFIGQCALLAPVDTTSIPAGASPNPPVPAASTAATEFSVQIAAYNARADATSLFNRLKQRGFDVRVVGDRAPYRFRIGRYATRAEAVAALGRMRAAQVNGIVVEAERR